MSDLSLRRSEEEGLDEQRREAHPAWAVAMSFVFMFTTAGFLPLSQKLAYFAWGDQSELWFNLLMGIGCLCGALTGPILGGLSDRYGRKPFILLASLSLLVPLVSLLVFRLDRSPQGVTIFFCIYAGLAPFYGSLFAFMQAYIVDCVPPERRPAMLGLLMAFGAGVPCVLSPMFFTWIEERWLMDGANIAEVASAAVLPVLVLFAPESATPRADGQRPQRQNPLRSFRMLCDSSVDATLVDGRSVMRVLRALMALILILYTVLMGFNLALGLYAQEQLGFSARAAGYLMSAHALVMIVANLCTGLVVKFLSRRAAVIMSVALAAIGPGLVAIPNAPPEILFVATGIVAFGSMAYAIGLSIASDIVPKEKTGEVIMVFNVAIMLGSGLGPMVFGIVITAFNNTDYPSGAFLVLAGVIVSSLAFAPLLPLDNALTSIKVSAPMSGSVPHTDSLLSMQENHAISNDVSLPAAAVA